MGLRDRHQEELRVWRLTGPQDQLHTGPQGSPRTVRPVRLRTARPGLPPGALLEQELPHALGGAVRRRNPRPVRPRSAT
jgi:hypothetical protein